MEKNNLLPIEKGLASKIYGLAFQDPQSSYNLAKQIGTQPHHVNAKIKELYKQKYLLKIENKEWRWPRWRANPDALIKKIEQIKQQEHITLTELDTQVLSERFNNYLFRTLSCQSFQGEVEKNTNANAVDDILCGFEMFMRLMEQSSEYVEACNKITTKADYQKMRREQKKSIKHLWLQYKLNIFVNTIKDEDIPALQNYIEINFGKKMQIVC